jgi:hypothetical protein
MPMQRILPQKVPVVQKLALAETSGGSRRTEFIERSCCVRSTMRPGRLTDVVSEVDRAKRVAVLKVVSRRVVQGW